MQIKPALNLLIKSTADVIPADDLLFGEEMKIIKYIKYIFGKEMKKVTTLEKASKDIVKAP